MTLKEDFGAIANWIEVNSRENGPAFNGSASDHQVEVAERRLGLALAPSNRRFYLLVDGQPRSRAAALSRRFWGCFQLVPIQDAAENAEFLNEAFLNGISVPDVDHAPIRGAS
ncbi:hypothetical protein [Fulvimarina sp. MAC3]|uniref:hypothetical protein n=1 Tax=Fulvimarina sp. MAC3 TaxID=3148887 RepID=UPI0031FCA0BD